MVEQTTETVYKCTCDLADCRHRWTSDEIPSRCAKCKRYTWNRPPIRHGRNGKQIQAFGKSQTIAAWAREYKISKQSIHARIKHGWPVEDAIAIPVHHKVEEATQ